KLAKNLDSKTSNTQKPHSDFFILIVFKTEISAWFYLKLLFAQPHDFRKCAIPSSTHWGS
ncbi:hypothetical protein DIX90_06970, partial [Streptococcus iniae]